MTIVHCDVRIENCAAEVYVNDIPVLRLAATNRLFQTRPIVEFVVDGSNRLEAVLNPGVSPSHARDSLGVPPPAAGAKLDVRMVAYQEGDFPGGGRGQELAGITFDAGAGAPSPTAVSFRANSRSMFGGYTWAWQRATAAALDATRLAAVTGMLHVFHDAFSTRTPRPILNLTDVYYQEYAQAYPGRSYAELTQSVVASLTRGRPEWNVAPLDEARFDFRLCADGRLVECVDRDWNPVIRAVVGDQPAYAFPIMAGFYQGRWQVLR